MAIVTISLGANIQAAINANPAGTVFQLAAGTYRGQQFEAKAGDQFIGDPSGGTILSGALLLNQWTVSGSYWVQKGLPATLVGNNVSGSNPLAMDLNDLFVDNVVRTRVASLAQVNAGKWYFDPTSNSVYISDNPTGKTVEYSATPNMIYDNGATGVVFKNLSVEKYATNAQNAPLQGGVNWQILNVTSTQNHGAGLYLGAGEIVQGGHFVDNGQVGIEGYQANGAQVVGAEISRNNYAGYNTGWDAGGIKIAGTNNLTLSGNTVSDNTGQGIWADIDSSNWTVSGNTVANNTGNGIMYEISHGATTITNNSVTNNNGSGIYISNSDGVTASGNTVTVNPANVFNTLGAAMGGGIVIINNSGRGNDPAGVPYQSLNDNVHNNVIIQANTSAKNGLWAYQALPSNANNVFNANTYYVPNATGSFWHFGNSDYSWSSLKQSGSNESTGVVNIGLPLAVPPPPTSVTVGSGADSVVLKISENAYANGDSVSDAAGDANFAVAVDGKQQGGTYTATASHAAGIDQSMTFRGYFGTGAHTVTVTFLNDAYNTAAPDAHGSVDRNLFVDSVVYNAVNTLQSAALFSTGPANFTATGGTTTPPPPPVTDTLSLKMSEDAYLGDAQYTVSVNGKQLGGTQTATASHAAGQDTMLMLTGSFGPDPTVVVTFLNDAWGGTSLDRNLFVDGITYDGVVQTASAAFFTNASIGFALHSDPLSAIKTNGSLVLADTAGTAATLAVIQSGSQTSVGGTNTKLTGNVSQSIDAQGVANISTNAFGQGVVSGALKDVGGASYHLSNFISTNAEVGGAAAGSLTVDQAAGGKIAVDAGNYNVSVVAAAAANVAANTFTVILGGSGNDNLLIDDSATRAVSTNLISAGLGNDKMTLIGAKSNTVTGGSGSDSVTSTSGQNTFIAGSGTLTATGGTGSDAYVFHASSGMLNIKDFSLAKGDTLTVDAALKPALTEVSDSKGGVIISFGTVGHGVDIAGLTTLAPSGIKFL